MNEDFQVSGSNPDALFTLKVHRGDGMALLAMNWRNGTPPNDFVGFAIEYKEPGGDRFFPLKNRLAFATATGGVDPNRLSTRLSPIQKFRWVHFPRNAELEGHFIYRVSPVFMNGFDELSYGEAQEVAIELRRETYPGVLNLSFTRGFVSSQAFVDRYEKAGPISSLLPPNAAAGLTFQPTHPRTDQALSWMGFEARSAILEVLDQAIADPTASVQVVAYDLSEPEVVSRLETLGARLRVIIDDSGEHGEIHSGESQAAERLRVSAGADNVRRSHMLGLQHNKTIIVDSPTLQVVVCGSTNFSWRGLYVQSNAALVLHGQPVVEHFHTAFENYLSSQPNSFRTTASAQWNDLELPAIDAEVAFSPHAETNALLATIARDIDDGTTSSLFFSLAFLYQTPGPIQDAIKQVSLRDVFVYGMSDRRVGGLDFQRPNGNVSPVYPSALRKSVPPPFSEEPTGGGGIRMHHKFVVIDFDKPTARVYAGSYNFSIPADLRNGENLMLIRDRRIATSFVVEGIRLFDHYHFRLAQQDARRARRQLNLARPPRQPGEVAWWAEDYTDLNKIQDRELFA